MTNSPTTEHNRVLHIISGDLWAGAEVQAFTLLKHLKPLCDVSAVLLNDGELASRLRAIDVPVTIFNETELSTWDIFIELRRHISHLRPAVIHTHRQKEHILGALANSTTIKTRCVRTVHGSPEYNGNLKTKIQQKLDSWVGNHLQNTIIAVSDDLKDKLASVYPSNKIKVVLNGVDVDALKSSIGTADFKVAQPAKKHIGIIGRLVPVKRIDTFIEAAGLFHKEKNDDYQFHIIGEGPLRSELELQAKNLNLTDLVIFHGHRDDIPSCINSLDAVVICSDHEGMPMVALETLALGKELCTYAMGGLLTLLSLVNREPIADRSPESLKHSIQNLKMQPLENIQFPLTGKHNAEQTFTVYSISNNQARGVINESA